MASNTRRGAVSALLVVVVVAVVYTAVIWLSMRYYGDKLSSLIDVGIRAGTQESGGLGRHIVVFCNSYGYDGRAYHFVADDLSLLRRPP